MPVIDTRTGKILLTDKQLIKEAKRYLKSISNEDLMKKLIEVEDEIAKRKTGHQFKCKQGKKNEHISIG